MHNFKDISQDHDLGLVETGQEGNILVASWTNDIGTR